MSAWSTTAVSGVNRTATNVLTRPTTDAVSTAACTGVAGQTSEASSTRAAPPKLPTDHMPWKKLMIGLGRVASTCTPIAFIATSMPPLPRPSSTPPASSIGMLPAKPNSNRPVNSRGRQVSAIRRAPIRSVSRPPTCMAAMADTPAATSSPAIQDVSSPSRSRSAASEAA